MPHRGTNDQLLVDALSEPIQPPTDPNGASHTMNRLAYAARTKGERGRQHNAISRWNYTPSWAPGVIATSVYIQQHKGVELFIGVDLAHTDVGETSFRGASPYGWDNADLTIVVNGDRQGYELELGEKLTVARLAVAEAAQVFFNTIPLTS